MLSELWEIVFYFPHSFFILLLLSGCGMQSDIKQKRDEALPLGESMTPETQTITYGVGG